MGGTAFQKSPVGSIFYDFFGSNTMKSDISISVSELGSLLDHSGPHKEAEEYIARVFNAERSYMVTNGTLPLTKSSACTPRRPAAPCSIDRKLPQIADSPDDDERHYADLLPSDP